MIKNYLLVAFRNLKRYKLFSFINISGLAIGMACSFLIFIWVKDEYSFDRFHKHEADLYRIVDEVENADALFKAVVTPYPMTSYLNIEIPEIINYVCIRPQSEKILVEYEPGESDGPVKKFYEGKVIAADSTFFEFFTYEFVKGNPGTAIDGMNSIVITESMAIKYFGDEDYKQLYLLEMRQSTLFNYFTILAIFISCLGILGLTTFMAQQRTKEIGIRKALGSSVSGIISMLSTEFSKWVIFANFIAIPLSWFFMNKWLENFAYRTNIPWWIFVAAAGIALLIAIITVSFQSYRAASANLAESLRQE